MVNNWHTSIAHSYGRVRHNAARAASFLKPPSRRRGEDCIVRSMTYEQPFIRSHATCQTEQIRHSLQTLKIATCDLLTRREQLALQATLRATHAPTCHPRPPSLNRKMKKYAPTPIAAELFPNFISGTDTVRRPELFEQFCVPIKNSWLLFSWNYLRKSKNWMSFEDLECGVRRPANLHLPLKSYVGH